MTAFNFKLVTLAAAAAGFLALSGPAQARGPFDGAWNVEFTGNSGTCDGMNYQYGVEVTNGVLHYSGSDAHISGTVSPSGDVTAHVALADSSATGSGRISGHSGRGKFHGRNASGVCTGNWSATRSGG